VSDDTDEFTEDKLRSMAAGLALMEAERQVFADGGAVDDEGEDGAREHDARHRRPLNRRPHRAPHRDAERLL
jgi:hypothetical protein